MYSEDIDHHAFNFFFLIFFLTTYTYVYNIIPSVTLQSLEILLEVEEYGAADTELSKEERREEEVLHQI